MLDGPHSCAHLLLNEACGLALDAGRREVELERELVAQAAEAQRLRLLRLATLERVQMRAASLMAAQNIDGARALTSLYRVMADE